MACQILETTEQIDAIEFRRELLGSVVIGQGAVEIAARLLRPALLQQGRNRYAGMGIGRDRGRNTAEIQDPSRILWSNALMTEILRQFFIAGILVGADLMQGSEGQADDEGRALPWNESALECHQAAVKSTSRRPVRAP